MPLVTSNAILKDALENHYAVGAFNANNMEQIQGIVEAAQEERAPVILQVSQGAIRYAGLEFAANMVRIAASLVDVPVVLHLDHGTDFYQNVRCLRAGFTSLMFDGHELPFDENVEITSRVTEIAHAVDIPVEAELGSVLQVGATPEEVEAALTDPDEAIRFVELTEVDSLAVALGSIHAVKTRCVDLDLERTEAIHAAIPDVPLVLHGSSGCTHESVVAVIERGICKVNVATYLNQAFMKGMKEGLESMPDNTDPRKVLSLSRDGVKERVREKMRLFGCSGVIDSSGGFASPKKSYRSTELGDIE
jgi:fructose-bisphosphate aldolase class II